MLPPDDVAAAVTLRQRYAATLMLPCPRAITLACRLML